ncbi:MAG: hypothetical protein RID91_17120 [Azospirillaceae bacterium]
MIRDSRFRRRGLLKTAGAGGLVAAAPGVFLGPRLAGAAETVRTLMWEGYEMRVPPAEGYEVQPTFMVANEDPINKRGTYDVSVGILGIFDTLHTAGVMQPLDKARLPNWSLLDPEFVNDPLIVQGGDLVGMPYVWASLGFTYLDEGGAAPTKLEDLLDPRFKGRLGIGDDGNSVIIQVARMLGLGGDQPGYLTSEEMDRVFEVLGQFKENAFGVIANPYAEFAGAYTRGEIVAAFPDNAPTTLRVAEAGLDCKVAFDPASAFSWIDALFIASDVEASDTIYKFLDDGLRTETQYAIGKELGWAVANGEAMTRLAGEGPLWSIYADRAQVFANAPNVAWPPLESDTYETYDVWLKRWQDFKAS